MADRWPRTITRALDHKFESAETVSQVILDTVEAQKYLDESEAPMSIRAQHVQYETNIDDMDPRLWPHVIDSLLAVGADDAWTVPILMKKGRPAFTLCVLCEESVAPVVRQTIFRETTTIGLRELPLQKHVLQRDEQQLEVGGQTIGVKTAYSDDSVVNRSVEWDDVVSAAKALGLSAKDVLAAATSAAQKPGEQGL